MQKYPLSWSVAHAHVWIDPDADRQFTPVTILPIIGTGPRDMHPGHVYRCKECGQEVEIPIRFLEPPRGRH